MTLQSQRGLRPNNDVVIIPVEAMMWSRCTIPVVPALTIGSDPRLITSLHKATRTVGGSTINAHWPLEPPKIIPHNNTKVR